MLLRQVRLQTWVPSRLQTDMIVSEPISQGISGAETLNDFMRIKIYFPIIDTALTELRRRFSDGNVAILRAVNAQTIWRCQTVYHPAYSRPQMSFDKFQTTEGPTVQLQRILLVR